MGRQNAGKYLVPCPLYLEIGGGAPCNKAKGTSFFEILCNTYVHTYQRITLVVVVVQYFSVLTPSMVFTQHRKNQRYLAMEHYYYFN
jgi:hypothetical protein